MTGRRVRDLTSGPIFEESLDDLAAHVRDGDTIHLGGFHFCRQPIQLTEAIAAAGTRQLQHVQWGGSLALEILLAAGAVDRLTFCFSNLDIFGLAPQFRRQLERGVLEHTELTALELHQALLAAQMNLDALELQVPAGSWRAREYSGRLIGRSPDVPLGTVLLHAQRADSLGNLELDGPLGLDRSFALAAPRVLATVEEIVEPGALRNRGASIPRQFVTAVTLSSAGAWPTSCPGYYVPDYREIDRRVRSGEPAGTPAPAPDPVISRPAQLQWARMRWPEPARPSAAPAQTAIADLMVTWLARRLDNTSVCSIGAVSPLPTAAYLTAKRTHAPNLTIVSSSGGCVDIGARFMSLSFGEAADVQSAAHLCGGDDSYRWFYQQSRVTHEVVSAAQIDPFGRTNNSWIPRPGRPSLRLPGQGGMADVANMHRNFILYATRQSPRQLVPEVDWVSSARAFHTALERATHGYGPGTVQLLTNLAVFELGPDGRFAIVSIHPGVELDEVREQTGFAIDAPSPPPATEPVTAAERAALDEVDPFGVRMLEFTPAEGRDAAISAILAAEASYLQQLERS